MLAPCTARRGDAATTWRRAEPCRSCQHRRRRPRARTCRSRRLPRRSRGRDPVVNVFAEHRARTTSLEPRWLGGEVWGRYRDGSGWPLPATSGPTWCPVQCDADDATAFAARARPDRAHYRDHRRPGPGGGRLLGAAWAGDGDRPRDIRRRQPHLQLDRPGRRRARPRRTPHAPATTSTPSIPPAWRCTPRRSGSRRAGRRRRPLPHPRAPAGQPRLVLRALRRRPAGVQGRGGAVRRRRPPRCRASGWRRTAAARGWRRAAWPPSWSWSAARSRRVVALYVNEFNEPARAGLPPGRVHRVGALHDDHVLIVRGRKWFRPRVRRTGSLARMNRPRRASARASAGTPMILRMSTLFVRTLREDPADAEVPSHRLLVRAGYIRRAAPGLYTWLPLGYRVLRRIEQIIRDEMDRDRVLRRCTSRRCCPREPYEAHRPLDGVRRRHLPAEGPQGRRLPPRRPPTRRCSRWW